MIAEALPNEDMLQLARVGSVEAVGDSRLIVDIDGDERLGREESGEEVLEPHDLDDTEREGHELDFKSVRGKGVLTLGEPDDGHGVEENDGAGSRGVGVLVLIDNPRSIRVCCDDWLER